MRLLYTRPDHVGSGLHQEGQAGSPDEIKEFMSDNICRCGAYPNIVAAITEVKTADRKSDHCRFNPFS